MRIPGSGDNKQADTIINCKDLSCRQRHNMPASDSNFFFKANNIKGGSRLAPLPYMLCIDNHSISATKYLSLFVQQKK